MWTLPLLGATWISALVGVAWGVRWLRDASLTARPPGWWYHLTLGALGLWSLWVASLPESQLTKGRFDVVVPWGFFFAVWLARLARARRSTRGGVGLTLRLWLVAPVMLATFGVVLAVNAPWKLRWALSENALRSLASEPVADGGYLRAGRVRVLSMEPLPSGPVLLYVEGDFGEERGCGFAYVPGGVSVDGATIDRVMHDVKEINRDLAFWGADTTDWARFCTQVSPAQ